MKFRNILILLLIIASFLPPTMVAAQPYNYKEVQFGNYKYDYYFVDGSDWIILFMPGGIGYTDRIDGCLGKWDVKNGTCITNPRSDEWMARIFIDNGINFIEPQKYVYRLSDDWVLYMLAHLRTDLHYDNILLSGFSGGGSVAASMPTVYTDLQKFVKASIIYEGPTIKETVGPMGSGYKAYKSSTKTFLAYGLNDTVVGPENGSVYIRAMPSSIQKMLVTIPVRHDMSIIPYTLDMMFAFIGKPRPPQYTVETSIIQYTTEITRTQTETSFISVTATTIAATTTEFNVTTSTRIIKSFAPNWEATRNAIIVMFWFTALILSVWFIRKKRNENRKSESG